jgi:hypothetical protein
MILMAMTLASPEPRVTGGRSTASGLTLGS